METGWIKDNGSWYFLRNDGVMLTGWIQDDGKSYYLNPNGSMKTGWLQQDSDWYYLNASGEKVTGDKEINGSIHRFNYDGCWIEEFNPSKNGWVSENDNWYFYENGNKKSDCWLSLDGKRYYLYYSGVMATDWHSVDRKDYYFNKSGEMQTGWIDYESERYLLNEDGSKVKKYTYINGIRNNFDERGVWLGEDKRIEPGWIYIQAKSEYTNFWMYLNENGNPIENQWLDYNGHRYRFDENGRMLKREYFKENNNTYFFDKDGKMVTGWFDMSSESWSYFNELGVRQKGWLSYGGKWYFINKYGEMISPTFSYEIDNKLHSFDENGVWLGDVGNKTTVYQVDRRSNTYHMDSKCMKSFYENWSSPHFNNINNPIKLTFNEAKEKRMKACAWCHRGADNMDALIYPFKEVLKP